MIYIQILILLASLGCVIASYWLKRRFIDRILSHSIWQQVVILLGTSAFIFSILFILSLFYSRGFEETRLWNMLSHYMEPGNFGVFKDDNDGISHWLIFLTNFLGMILLGGMLIAVFSNMLERHVDKIKNGQIYYKFKGHIVIIGFDKMLIGLTKQLIEKNSRRKIVIQTTRDASTVRYELFAHLDEKDEKQITIASGYRNSMEDLKKLHIDKCEEVFLLGESGEYDHDSLNIDCLKKIKSILETKKCKTVLRCNVLFEYQSTYAAFQRQDLKDLQTRIDFVPFNFHEIWAQKLFVDGKYESPANSEKIIYPALDREGIDFDSPKTVHLVVVGMSNMGIALGIQASHLCHFPNFIKDKTKKTRITFIDEHAFREMNYLKGRYRHLFQEITHSFEDVENPAKNETSTPKDSFTDIEWHFIEGRIEDARIQKKIVDWRHEKDVYLTIAVCFSHPPSAIAAGLYLPDIVYEKKEEDVSVLIRQETSYSTLAMLGESPMYENIKPFGMLDNCYDLEKVDHPLPKMVHYVYSRTYELLEENKSKGEKQLLEPVEIFDPDELGKYWKKLKKISLKWSNIYNANSIGLKMRSFNIMAGKLLNDETVELMAKVEHNRWNIEKLLMGYRPATPQEKEAIAKGMIQKFDLKSRFIHTDICEYEQLDDEVREYDRSISRSLPFIERT